MHSSKISHHRHHVRSASRHIAPTLWCAFKTQIRVIRALIMREILTRYGRENIGFLWVIGEPILFCAGVAIMWTAIRPSHEHGLRITAMVVTGYVPLTMFRHCLSRAVRAYAVNSSLLFHKLVTPLDIITARALLEIIGTLLAGALVLAGSICFGYMEPPVDWGLMYAGLGFTAYFCYVISLLNAALTERSELFEKAIDIISYLALPWTGAFMMIDWLPPRFRWILENTSPIANAIEMTRAGVFGIQVVPHYSVWFMTLSTTFLFIISLQVTLSVRPHIKLS